MSEAMFTVEEVKAKCQKNTWLKIGGCDFEDDPMMELDYDYGLYTCLSLLELEQKMKQGNWSIRSAFAYDRLLFVNQVNGGDEWWTCYKHEDGSIEDFESITFRGFINRGEFKQLVERLLQGPDAYWGRNEEKEGA
ncbi:MULTISPECIES: hypothetical protein [Bacillus cereus group]|uniref:hypothetical protein n=1 Tax=Bacillus cereus group TaxID=86661 RepID=UPI000BFCCCC4|nr:MULTISPECIES: hypothetical protein [Bacillus cereus group]MBJ8109076.1 hypothetical protein [Bacillus cereus group sp. N6]PGT10167.1 hypothetical protein COD03_20585 [Bacillus cereus]TNP19074.1 hypothetical protein FHY73_15415 [Bacillus tropicus]